MAEAQTAGVPGWVLDEMAHAGRENLDPDHVTRYDLKEDAGAEAEVALLRAHGLAPDATLVDMGAGTGQVALAAAPTCGRVVAVDVSPVMLARLRAQVEAAGRHNVEVVHAGFLTYDHQGPPADVVYSRWALHHLPDMWKVVALRRMRGLLRPGGLLRLSDVAFAFDPSEVEERIEAWCAAYPDRSASGDDWVRTDVEEHVRDEHSTFTWLLEPMVERCGFRIEDASHSDDGLTAAYLARAV
ncbi:class I SAM-dependent methyltransferase [Iamia majanohamensis]|uniref:Class I SAM-dependent methyltransferase n=1 Tax=Iamia majanohamensis TaxID=467976 RepID=A0AAE9Y575_9ACTN|nr:class I SAM-dependent methyltransferase [Iamia majanohamensis]WCO66570.1 class I SAM-dependent methyltransferase [Iamia majanohamensis]